MQENLSHDLNLPLIEEGNSPLPLVIAVVLQYWGEDNLDLEKKNNQNNSTNIIDGIEVAEKKRYS